MPTTLNIKIIQYIGIFGSIIFITAIIGLIRNKKLKEEYSLLWLFFGIVFLFLSIWRHSLEYIALLLGIAYSPAALFLILIIAIVSILIHFSIVLSKLTETNKKLVQEIGLVKMELDLLIKNNNNEI